MFCVNEDLVFSVDKTGSGAAYSPSLRSLIVGMAPSVALWCVRPRKRLAAASFTPRPRAGNELSTRTAIVMQWPHFRRSSRPTCN